MKGNLKAYAFTTKQLDPWIVSGQERPSESKQRVSILFWEQEIIEGLKMEVTQLESHLRKIT